MKYPERLAVDVSLEDLRLGRMGNCLMCPIARALRDKGFEKFSVTESHLEFDNGVLYATPPSAARFIRLYDAGYMPRSRSFTFTLLRKPKAVRDAEVDVVVKKCSASPDETLATVGVRNG